MKPIPNYVLEYQIRLKGMTNEELLDDLIEQAGGDDWEGGFTNRGYRLFNTTRGELNKRLIEIGFLPKNET